LSQSWFFFSLVAAVFWWGGPGCPTAEAGPIYAIDLDQTLVLKIPPDEVDRFPSERVIRIDYDTGLKLNTEYYFLLPHAEEFITVLAAVPGARLFIVSAGNEARNLALADAIPIGAKRLSDYARVVPAVRGTKSLAALSPDIRESVLFDDHGEGIPADEVDHWIPITENDGSDRTPLLENLTFEQVRRSSRLVDAIGTLGAAIDRAGKTGTTTVQQIHWVRGHLGLAALRERGRQWLAAGNKLLPRHGLFRRACASLWALF
jgi:hypothetical protein